MTNYWVVFEASETGFGAYVPDLPGCISTGRTLEETKANIREAIEGHLAVLREFNDPVPERTTSTCLEVAVDENAYNFTANAA